ncbi:MAG: sulfite exporter TauE/SafE family protein [Proteobacteria bacterium]|nr:sulfite exporter TauE/SafE family protein [Desulfobacula sp.]MBU3953105.1 sulfite exporter TauE/SafE family protein [Pseudomonadota bacterium]MBU4130501.1 sulfite exporter TauE/SafE family protein [Pseudomonadota bacterium]
MKHKAKWIVLLIMAVAIIMPLVTAAPVMADKLSDAIAAAPQGTGKGQIDPTAPPGVLGIPGAPSPGLMVCFLWAIWVGWIFSTVGAFGGIMAGVGHITIYGLGAYAKTFKDTSPGLNKMLTDSIRVSNQWLVGLSALVSSVNYGRQNRLVKSLGFFLGIGALFATLLVVYTTAGKISFSQYQGWFGLCVFLIAAFMIYEMSPKGQAKKQSAKAAAKAFEETVKNKGDIVDQGVKTLKWSFTKTEIAFFGQKFSFSPMWAFVGGFLISALASFIGVGGGFLYVPFLTSVVGLPMFVVAGTSALAVLIGMIFSIFNFMVIKGVMIYWPMIGIELIGIFVGSMIGPRTGKYIPEKALKWIFLVLAFYIGLRYTLRGFFGISML